MRADSTKRTLSGRECSSYHRLGDGGGGKATMEGLLRRLDSAFEVSQRGSSISTEIRGGVVGWMTTSYILVVNPAILYVASGSSGVGMAPLVTATALSSAFGSLLVGLTTNMPFGLVPGMGLNAYFTYGICAALGVSYQQALSSSMMGGIALLALCALGACDLVVRWVLSDHLKKAITAAIGMFQAMIGFQAMGLVVRSQDTLVTVGNLAPSWESAHLYLALGGLMLIAGLLVGAQLRGSMLVGILTMAGCSWVMGLDPAPQALLAAPSFSSAFQVDFSGWQLSSPHLPGLAAGAAVLLFVCLFDVAGVQHGLQSAAGIPMEDRRSPRVIGVVALSTAFGALCGTSPVIVATESSAAILEGARTGLAAVTMAALFLTSAVIAPLISAVPRVVTAVPLVVVGAFMMAPARGIAWDELRVALPSFLTLTVVPFTYSIHNGIIAGLLVDLYLSFCTRAAQLRRGTPRPGEPRAEQLHSPTFHSPAGLCVPAHAAHSEEDGDESVQAELARLRRLAAELLAERAIHVVETPAGATGNAVAAAGIGPSSKVLEQVATDIDSIPAHHPQRPLHGAAAVKVANGHASGTTTATNSAVSGTSAVTSAEGSGSECNTPTKTVPV